MRDLFERDAAVRSREAARQVLRGIVARVGNATCATSCGLSPTHLSTSLGDKPGDRYLRDEHIDAILILATDAERLTYWTARMGWCGYAAGPKHVRSAEERLAALEYRVAVALGAAGADVVEQERSRP